MKKIDGEKKQNFPENYKTCVDLAQILTNAIEVGIYLNLTSF